VNNTFGKITKNEYKPASDFRYEICTKVICVNARQTGYMLKIYPERINEDDSVDVM
jgi:hypothetical protein